MKLEICSPDRNMSKFIIIFHTKMSKRTKNIGYKLQLGSRPVKILETHYKHPVRIFTCCFVAAHLFGACPIWTNRRQHPLCIHGRRHFASCRSVPVREHWRQNCSGSECRAPHRAHPVCGINRAAGASQKINAQIRYCRWPSRSGPDME